jgi:hypothetical protein
MQYKSIFKIFPAVLRKGNAQPTRLVPINDPAITKFKVMGKDLQVVDPAATEPLRLTVLELSEEESAVEISFTEQSREVGVQFWGNEQSGWATIWVDGFERWRGNLAADGAQDHYVEIQRLPLQAHKVRVIALGEAGREGGGVTVQIAALGVGPTAHRTFIPVASNPGNQ